MKKIIKGIVSVVLLTSMFSCSLDRSPLDTISEDSFYKSKADFELSANNFYNSLHGFSFGDSESDIARGSSSNSISTGTNTIPESSGTWNDNYGLIRRTSYLIMKSEESEIRDEIKVYEAEAKFFRAYAYFSLVKTFSGVPLITRVLDVNDAEIMAARASRDEIITQIFKDLDEAIVDLPLESDIPDIKKGRISKGAALAFKARISLFEGTWRKYRGENGDEYINRAITASSAVMDQNMYELFKSEGLGDDSYFYFFGLENQQSNPLSLTKQDQKEIILARKYDSDLASHSGFTNWLHANTVSPTKKMVDMYLCTDGLPTTISPLFEGQLTFTSEFQNRDIRMKNNMMTPGERYWGIGGGWGKDWTNPTVGGFIYLTEAVFGNRTSTGYSPRKLGTERLTGGEGNDYPVIRYAEILLIYAEALFEKNGTITDAELNKSINLLRKRVDMPSLTNAFVAQHGLNMKEEIRRERTVELVGENFRFDDLRRWYTAHIELKEEMKGVKYKGTEYETNEFTAGQKNPVDSEGYLIVEGKNERLFDKNKNYLFPIPSGQILINSNLEQNPNWK